MKDLANNQNQNEAHLNYEAPTSELLFEEELRRQNIRTMIEIYGEEYFTKIEMLTR